MKMYTASMQNGVTILNRTPVPKRLMGRSTISFMKKTKDTTGVSLCVISMRLVNSERIEVNRRSTDRVVRTKSQGVAKRIVFSKKPRTPGKRETPPTLGALSTGDRDTSVGELSGFISSHPTLFDSFFIRGIENGEAAGTH